MTKATQGAQMNGIVGVDLTIGTPEESARKLNEGYSLKWKEEPIFKIGDRVKHTMFPDDEGVVERLNEDGSIRVVWKSDDFGSYLPDVLTLAAPASFKIGDRVRRFDGSEGIVIGGDENGFLAAFDDIVDWCSLSELTLIPPPLKVGDRVRHAVHGEGVIEEISRFQTACVVKMDRAGRWPFSATALKPVPPLGSSASVAVPDATPEEPVEHACALRWCKEMTTRQGCCSERCDLFLVARGTIEARLHAFIEESTEKTRGQIIETNLADEITWAEAKTRDDLAALETRFREGFRKAVE
jgi:hypothetical protein